MSIAQITVISSPELLEHTLVQLSLRDLLVTAPLVSKTWQAITLTPTLQRLLFFQPDTSSGRAENPLLVELFAPFFVPGGPNRWTWPNFEAIKSMPWSKAPEAFKRPEASWRRMLVTQSPARRLVITERCHAQKPVISCAEQSWMIPVFAWVSSTTWSCHLLIGLHRHFSFAGPIARTAEMKLPSTLFTRLSVVWTCVAAEIPINDSTAMQTIPSKSNLERRFGYDGDLKRYSLLIELNTLNVRIFLRVYIILCTPSNF
ncbi:putative f-box domain protein [Mycena sanguinolenta]|uniref:Putative f-box domain protein n=1 Tax=Mycena sanguinolenta TaxID=230812 RepID=A0A8H6ZDY7_9AGAR|nr:putative f-box domain protein [Mycena sanguinolenta]